MSDIPGDLDLVFWPVGLSGRSFADHLEIAQAGGFTSLAVNPRRAKLLMAEGVSPQDMRDMAAERGLVFTQGDGIATWVKNWRAETGDPDFIGPMAEAFDIDMEEALDICAALGIWSVVAVPFFDEGSVPRDEMIESFARFCDSGAKRGINIDLEPIPFWGIRHLSLAWDVVREAGRDNAGIMIDTWHIQKGSPDYARDIALLETIPGERLMNVQLADADLTPRAPTLEGDVLFRRFPGEGELEMVRMLSIIAGKGHLRSAGPEIVNAEQDAMDNRAVGERSGRTTRDVVSRAMGNAAVA